jgi:hypothetical protein
VKSGGEELRLLVWWWHERSVAQESQESILVVLHCGAERQACHLAQRAVAQGRPKTLLAQSFEARLVQHGLVAPQHEGPLLCSACEMVCNQPDFVHLRCPLILEEALTTGQPINMIFLAIEVGEGKVMVVRVLLRGRGGGGGGGALCWGSGKPGMGSEGREFDGWAGGRKGGLALGDKGSGGRWGSGNVGGRGHKGRGGGWRQCQGQGGRRSGHDGDAPIAGKAVGVILRSGGGDVGRR